MVMLSLRGFGDSTLWREPHLCRRNGIDEDVSRLTPLDDEVGGCDERGVRHVLLGAVEEYG